MRKGESAAAAVVEPGGICVAVIGSLVCDGYGTIATMSFDAKNPPVWLRKLGLSAAGDSRNQYAASPEVGILLCCCLSDDVHAWSAMCADALALSPMSAPAPLDHPFDPERRGIRNAVR